MIGYTAFDYATSFGNLDLLKSLKAKNIKANDIALIQCCTRNKRKQVNGIDLYKYLIEDVKLKTYCSECRWFYGFTNCCEKPNQTEIINYLIGKELDANKADNEGNNALMAAASGKDLNNVKAILPKVKNINAMKCKW
jgi:ankyrin repeat protein